MRLTESQEIRFSRFGMYPFNWIINGKVLASVYPDGVEYLSYLRQSEGITLAVNLTQSPWDPDWQTKSGIRCIHHPIVDMSIPSVEIVKDIIREIDENDGCTMIHCAAGIGRTGTVIGLYLVEKGMEAEEAIRTVRKKRPGSIQTIDQEGLIRNWKQLR